MSWLEFFSIILPPSFWPISIAILGVALGPKLVKELPRLRKLGPSGLELFPHEGGQEKIADSVSGGLEINKIGSLSDPVAIDVEKEIKDGLAALPAEEREERLVRSLTHSQMFRSFSLAYADIFGSQIRALEKLNARDLSRDDASQLFSELQREKPVFRDWTLESYLGFLFHWKFISNENGFYVITQTGKNFLLFLTTMRLSKDRLH